MDTKAVTPIFCKAFTTAIGIDVTTLTPSRPFLTAGGWLENYMGVTEEVGFTLARGTSQERRCSLRATVVDTTAFCALLCMDIVAGVGGYLAYHFGLGYMSKVRLLVSGPRFAYRTNVGTILFHY